MQREPATPPLPTLIETLHEALHALNRLPNGRVDGERCRTSYEVAALIEKVLAANAASSVRHIESTNITP